MTTITSEEEWGAEDAGDKLLHELPVPKSEPGDDGKRIEFIGGKWKNYRSISAMLMRDVQKFPLLTPQEERALLVRYVETKEHETLDRLINCNLRLVAKWAGYYAGRYRMQFLDLFNEGALGLRKAILRFDIKRETKLSTYATWWIRQVLMRHIMDQKGVVRLPIHVQETMRKYRAASVRLMRRTGEPPSDEEVYKEAELKKAEINLLQYGSQREVYIEASGFKNDGEVAEMDIPDDRPLQDEATEGANLHDQITERALGILKPKWRAVIVMRFGLRDAPWDIEAIAKLLKCKKEEVLHIEAEAFARLKVPTEIVYSRSACEQWIKTISLRVLDPRQRFVMQLKHGLSGGGEILNDIGKAMGNTRELIRQVEERSLEKLRMRIVKDDDGEVKIKERAYR